MLYWIYKNIGAKSMDKKEFIDRLKSAYNDPSLFFENGKISPGKLQEFFQGFVDSFLQPSMSEFTDKKPEVIFEDFKEGSTKVDNPTGKYERDDSGKDKIIMSVKRFAQCKNPDELRNTLLEVMGIVCHEYHHFKQGIYGDMLESGNTEKANAIAGQMKISQEQFEHTTGIGAFKYDQLELMEKTMPGTIALIKLSGNPFGRSSKGVIRDALYFRNPLEKDARDSSLEVHNEIAKEIGATSGDKGLASHMKKVGRRQAKKNFIDDIRQPGTVIRAFENATAKIKPQHFIKFSEIIDNELKNPNKTPEQEERIKQMKETFTANLRAMKLMLGEEKFENFLAEIERIAPENSFVREVLKNGFEKKNAPTTEKVSIKDVEKERDAERGQEQEQAVAQSRPAREVAHELTPEEEQELAAQMDKRIDD